MKKKWLIVFAFLLLLFISIYIFIPGNISIGRTGIVQCTENGTIRTLQDFDRWQKWWPASGGVDSNHYFVYNHIKYHPDENFHNSISVLMESENSKISGRIQIFHLGLDSTAITWVGEYPTSQNPYKKIVTYFEAKQIQQDLTDILKSLDAFLAKKENIYGFPIQQTSTKDTLLISTKTVYPKKPGQKEIYGLIDSLKNYALAHGSRQNSYPLLNIRKLGGGSYQAMVAIPLDKYIDGAGKIESKRMVPGFFLKAEIVGGEATIENGFDQLDQYIHDFGKNDVAIPFQVLITDRSVETDTSKWITNIYYPIYH